MSGYNKNYTYDTRLKYLSPPYFLSPTQSAWIRISYAEVTAEPGAVSRGRTRSRRRNHRRRREGRWLACRACRRTGTSCARPRACSTCCRPNRPAGSSVVGRFATRAERFGYGLLLTPIVEHYEVFARVGETTDVVRKEMYDFVDRGGRRLALRPEGTAPVVRAFVQHRPADAVEGLVPRAELPGRAAAGRALPPALAARRRGDRDRRPRRRRRDHRAAVGLLPRPRPARRPPARSTRWATPRRATRYREVLLAYWHAHADAARRRDGARPRRTRCASSTRSAPTGPTCSSTRRSSAST